MAQLVIHSSSKVHIKRLQPALRLRFSQVEPELYPLLGLRFRVVGEEGKLQCNNMDT